MRGNLTKNRGLSLLLAVVVLLTGFMMQGHQTAEKATAATTKCMKVNTFIKHLVQTIDLQVDTTIKTPYIAAAVTAGIVKDGEFTDYSEYITRSDAAVLLNRADEYLNEGSVDEKLLKVILEKRISDIKKIAEGKRKDVARVYAKGIISGYTNGKYTQNRKFNGNDNITAGAAMKAIKLLTNKAGRSKISPDGQLIRTTNLPKNAKKYDYILASFPNKFYERKFEFMFTPLFDKGTLKQEYYAYPVEMRTEKFKNWYDEWAFSKEMDNYLYDWQSMAEKYLKYIFNVDYRTVDDDWVEGLASLYAKSNIDEAQDLRDYYIKPMKKNKVVVESSLISVEPSTLYDYLGYHMRAYVRYRITAKDMNVEQYQLLYSQYPYLTNLKSGQWREGIFDVKFSTNNGSSGDGADFAIDTSTRFVDTHNVPVE